MVLWLYESGIVEDVHSCGGYLKCLDYFDSYLWTGPDFCFEKIDFSFF